MSDYELLYTIIRVLDQLKDYTTDDLVELSDIGTDYLNEDELQLLRTNLPLLNKIVNT